MRLTIHGERVVEYTSGWQTLGGTNVSGGTSLIAALMRHSNFSQCAGTFRR